MLSVLIPDDIRLKLYVVEITHGFAASICHTLAFVQSLVGQETYPGWIVKSIVCTKTTGLNFASCCIAIAASIHAVSNSGDISIHAQRQ